MEDEIRNIYTEIKKQNQLKRKKEEEKGAPLLDNSDGDDDLSYFCESELVY